MKLSQRRLARPSLGGMLATRQGSLMLALICAVCAAGILVFALGRYKTSLKTPVTQASVLVATADIPKGTPGLQVASERLYKVAPVAVSQVSPGAISDASAIANESAAVDILPGQQLTSADFAGVTELAQTLSPGDRGLEVSVSETGGATDIVQAGDHVDVYAVLKDGAVRLLAANVLVLKAGGAVPVKRDGVTIAGQEMVLDLPADQVHLFVAAASNDSFYVSLRPLNANTTPGAAQALALFNLDTQSLNSLKSTPNFTNPKP